MKIVVFEVEPWERETFKNLERDHDIVYLEEPLTDETVNDFRDAEVISTFIYSEMNREVLQQFGQLKLVATRSTGFDHIDTDYCSEQDIAVSNVPTYGENTVAEHVFALLLTISHRMVEAVDRTRRGDFSPKGLSGFDLCGKTFGVIGTGHIGRHAMRIANGFDMDVIAYDVKPDKNLEADYKFEYVDFDDLLGRSDIISLHVPANKHTHHLISGEAFNKMKDGVVLINTARGEVVDVQALIRALAEGKVAAAGLDVLPEEPTIREEAELLRSVYTRSQNMETLLADHVLLRLRNVVITPHSAFNTKEAVQRILNTTRDNILRFTEGQPQNVVNAVPSRV